MENKTSFSAQPRRVASNLSVTKEHKFSSASTRRKPILSGDVKALLRSKSGRSQTTKKKSQLTPSETTVVDDEIKFINIESDSSHRKRDITQGSTKTIKAEEILERCQEKDYRNVYEINLRSSHLAEVPNLEKFSKVRVIDLSSNYIRIISRLECCAELRELKLYDNQLTSIEKLDALSDLSHLQLQHNRISSIDRGLVSCRKLLTLRLDCNNLSRLESKELASLSKLTTLDLSNNKLDNISALNSLPNLTELAVCNNRLRTMDLSRCKKLEELDVSGNRFADLNCFCVHASSLITLNISRNAVGKLEVSVPLHHLEELYISHNTVKRLSSVSSKLPVLQVLDLSHNHIRNDKELLNLRACDLLRELDLSNNPFELDEFGQVATNPAEVIPSLQILDGMVIRKQSHENKVPLMRPMSASHVISSRQVQSQLDSLDTEMEALQTSIEDKFRQFRASIDQLPSRPTSAICDPDRPVTRGSRRSHLMEAKAFAVNRYSEN